MAQLQIHKITHRHEAIIDWLLSNPHVKNLEVLCAEMEISRSHLSIIMNSGLFKKRFEDRRQEFNNSLNGKIQDKLIAVGDKAMDKLDALLDDPDCDPRLVADIADKTLQKLGYGASKGSGPMLKIHQREVETRTIDQGTLVEARRTIETIMEGPREALLPSPES